MENHFKAGGLVWAKVRHHPWWPSLICHETLASTQAQQAKKEGCVLVSFFGDNSYKWLDPRNVCHFESHYGVYANRSNSQLFVKAVSEAVYEVNHRAALGLTCPCQVFSSYRPAPVEGLLEIDVDGYTSGGVYNLEQIQQFRQEFRPVETLLFVRQLALGSADVPQDIDYSKEAARVLAFRKARYAEVDEPYFQAFGVDPSRPGDPMVASNNQEAALIQAPTAHPLELASQGQEKPTVKCQSKSKRRPATPKDKPQATKAKSSVKRYQRHGSDQKISKDHVPEKKKLVELDVEKLDLTSATDNEREDFFDPTDHPSEHDSQSREKRTIKSRKKNKRHIVTPKDGPRATTATSSVKNDRSHDSNNKTCQDQVPEKKRHVKFEVERKLNLALLSDDERERSPNLSKNPSTSKDHKKGNSSATTGTSHFVKKVKDSAPTSTPLKKRKQLVTSVETISPEKKRKEQEKGTIVKPLEQGPKAILSMKFPQDTALPSSSELKAKFARFGPLDTSDIRVSWAKSRCQVVFMNKSDAEKAHEHASRFEDMFGETKVTYRLQEKAPVTPPRDGVISRSSCVCRIERCAEEIYAEYPEEVDQTCVEVKPGNVDISEKMLNLLNECSRIVRELKSS